MCLTIQPIEVLTILGVKKKKILELFFPLLYEFNSELSHIYCLIRKISLKHSFYEVHPSSGSNLLYLVEMNIAAGDTGVTCLPL